MARPVPRSRRTSYYIVPSKCTECVGFHDHEACAAVCPVDCCIPDPNNLESEGVLLARARELHPETTFPDDAPSRFRKEATGARSTSGKWRSSNVGACTQASGTRRAPKPAGAAPAATRGNCSLGAEYNPVTWAVPVICKDCDEPLSIPYRLFQTGVVFHCPTCSGSFVPKTAMYRAVSETFEGFYNRRRREREAFERKRRAKQRRSKRGRPPKRKHSSSSQEMAHSMKPRAR